MDLAYISAGEGDREIHKVNCLQSATAGYAPLVFDCNEQCDYTIFLERCQLVWRELKTNHNLPTQLVSCRVKVFEISHFVLFSVVSSN